MRQVVLVVCGALLLGCASSRETFTNELRQKENLTTTELRNLQYYLVGEIVLERKVTSETRDVSAVHRLVRRKGVLIDQIVVENDTPGIATAVEDTAIAIKFSPEDVLRFECDRLQEKRYGRYELQISSEGKVRFDGAEYDAIVGSRSAHLAIDLDQLSSIKKNRKVLEGMRLESR